MDEEKYIGMTELTEEEELGMYRFEELVSAPSPVVLGPTDPSKWKRWKLRDQASSSSCVYQARAKAGGILREMKTGSFVEYSAADYNKRTNPGPGSNIVESFKYWKDLGMGLEALEPSQKLSESELAKIKQDPFDKEVAALSKIENWVNLPNGNFDVMISTLAATGKPIPFGFYATREEWRQTNGIMDIKQEIPLSQAYARHAVCATPNYGIWQGKEGFTFEDSSVPGINGTGVIFMTREFYEKRNYLVALYPTAFKLQDQTSNPSLKPKILLTRSLGLGDEGTDVRALQEVLKYEGFFPSNHPGSNIFWTITQDAVKKYQAKYDIVSSGTPETTGFGRVGPKTMAHINYLYK